MKNYILLSLFFVSLLGYSQKFKLDITARVDTTNTTIKQVYHLYNDYINSNPDSIYKNPHWNDAEATKFIKNKLLAERSANKMYQYFGSKRYLSYYTPKILQIDSVAVNRYQIKTLFAHDCAEDQYKNSTPMEITKLYAVRDKSGKFKLENLINYDTRNWKTHQIQFIKYVVHPNCEFDKKEALKAIEFCRKIAKRFDLTIIPFTYYILPNSDELGKLYNFEYWLSYIGGQANIPNREVFTTYSNTNFPHEFVHILFPLRENGTMIISEGLATWLSGPSYNESFEEALIETSKKLQKTQNVSLDEIINFNIRNEFDNTILYVTGGVICKFVYEKHGDKGIWELYNNTSNENFKETLERLFEESYQELDKKVINYIKNYSKI